MSVIDEFKKLSQEERFKGWPLVGEIDKMPKIPYFGNTIKYTLRTGNGNEEYTSIIRQFGWVVVFGITKDGKVITLCQWKPGVNCASWELPPGGIGNLLSGTPLDEIESRTKEAYLKETGYGNGNWNYLGNILIESGKYRGASPADNGFKAHLFIAEHLEFIQNKREPNPNEVMETIMVPIEEFREVLESGLFLEESAVACAYKALIKLGKLQWM